MPYEWTYYDPLSDTVTELPGPAEPDFGDETELEIIISKGYDEAEDFGDHAILSFGEVFHPAKWLNPPSKIAPDRWDDFVIWHSEDFIKLKEDDGSS